MRLSESIPGNNLIWKGSAMAFCGEWLPLIVMLVGFSSATAKIPKGAQKALKTKYLHSSDLPAFFGPPITGEQGQSAWLSRSRVLLGQREPASPASAHRHPSQHGAAL